MPELPEIVDLSQAAAPAPVNDLFDDQTKRGFAPAPKPRSTHFYKNDKRLQCLETKMLYIGATLPNGTRRHWDLWGPRAGRQGLMLAPGFSGLMHLPFVQLMSEGPYQVGAIPERTDFRKREMSFAVMVNVGWGPDTSFRYRMLEERWWQSWSPKSNGFWGVYTRTHGWRWVKVRLAEEPKTPFQLDPVANDNNFMQWDMTAVAPDPYWYKRKLVRTWANVSEDGAPPPYEGVIPIFNRGSEPAHPAFIVSSPGQAWLQDGPNGRMVAGPLLSASDGYVLIDTDPIKRTATSATDPIDPIYMRILRNTQLLDFILHDITSATLPVWRRMNGFFQVPWPARSIANIRVRHSQPGGTIAALMPQRYASGFG